MTARNYLHSLQKILERQARRTVSRRVMAIELRDLLSATGLRLRGPGSSEWAQFAIDSEDHATNAKELARIAQSPDPLTAARHAPALIERRAFSVLNVWWKWQQRRPRFKALPSDLRDVSWKQLGNERKETSAQIHIRSHIQRLRLYEEGLAPRRGRPFKGDQEAVLEGLAEIFTELTGTSGHPLELPSSPNSRFIQFAHVALAPYMSATEASVDALASRWRRTKARAAAL